MKINFNKVHLKNFFSFSDAEIELDRPGYTLITGVNQNPDDAAKSNGSGKSAFLESIVWTITGETIRGSKNVSNIYTGKGAEVTLDFSIDNIPYQLKRSKDPSSLKFYVNGEDKSAKGIRDTEKVLAEYLPDLTSQLLGSVIVFGQGLPNRFTNNTPAGRKEVLEKLFKTDFMIADIKSRINLRDAELKKQIRTCEDNILSGNSQKTIYENQTKEANEKLAYYNVVDISALNNSIVEIDTQIADYDSRIEYQDKELTQINNDANTVQRELNNKNDEYTTALNRVVSGHGSERAQFQQTDTDKKVAIKTLETEIEKLKNIRDVCPTCGHKLEGVEKPDTTTKENELTILNAEYADFKVKYDKFEADIIVEQEKVKIKYNNELNSLRRNLTSLHDQIGIINRNILGMTQEKNKLNAQKTSIQTTINTNELNKLAGIKVIEDNTSNINEIDQQILYNNNEKEILNAHADVIGKLNSLTARDFRGYLLSDIINIINQEAKQYSKTVFGTDALNFKLDGNNLSISYDGKEIESLSGGERQKCDLIIQFAIRDCLCKNLGFSSNFLCLDECLDNLDSIGCDKIIDLIQAATNDISTIFIVTHHSDSLDIPCDHELIIMKGSDKISRIQ